MFSGTKLEVKINTFNLFNCETRRALFQSIFLLTLVFVFFIGVVFSFTQVEAAGMGEIENIPEEIVYPVELEDAEGETVILEEEPQKIVSLGSSFNELLVILGAEDKLIGRDETESIVIEEKIADVPTVGSSAYRFQTEKVIEMDPDIFIANNMLSDDNRRQLESFDIPVLVEDEGSLTRLSHLLKNMGKIAGEGEKTNELYDYLQENFQKIEERTSEIEDNEKPDVYIEWSDRGPFHTASGMSNIHTFIELAAGNNIGEEVRGGPYPQVSSEFVWESDPDIIVINAGRNVSSEEMREIRNEIMARDALQEVTAVKEENVHIMSGDILWGFRAIVGNLYLAEWFHPDLFTDINPASMLQEIHGDFYEYEGEDLPAIFPAE